MHNITGNSSTEESGSERLAYSYVRFSSEGQREGTSLERQSKAAQIWADRNDCVLSNETFQDLGVSAFKGSNVTLGRLGQFLEAVESRAVPQGSVLVVESLDRISRDKIRKARNTLENIIDAGVDVVTLNDGKVYTKADLDDDAMTGIMIILTFQRAHEESEMKSKRVSSAWKINAEKVAAGTRKRSTKVPAWIEHSGSSLEELTFTVIEEKAVVVAEAFSRFADGEPCSSIGRDFRERGIPLLGGPRKVRKEDAATLNRGLWGGTNVRLLVTTVTPYGNLEVGKGQGRERRIIETIKGYYPRIVDEEIERRVRFRLSQSDDAATKYKMPSRPTAGRLIGVLKSADGYAVKTKRNNRSVGYSVGKTNQYLGAVSLIDQVLLDEWCTVTDALGVESNEAAEGTSEQLEAARDALSILHDRAAQRSTPTLERLVIAARAEVEELERDVSELKASSRMIRDVPLDLEALTVPEANQFVRRVIETAGVYREGKGSGAKVVLQLKLANGIQLSIGDVTIGMVPRGN